MAVRLDASLLPLTPLNNRLDTHPSWPHLPEQQTCASAGLNKSLRAMARASTVINACFPLNIAPIEVPRYRAVNEEVGFHTTPVSPRFY